MFPVRRPAIRGTALAGRDLPSVVARQRDGGRSGREEERRRGLAALPPHQSAPSREVCVVWEGPRPRGPFHTVAEAGDHPLGGISGFRLPSEFTAIPDRGYSAVAAIGEEGNGRARVLADLLQADAGAALKGSARHICS